MSVSLFQLLLRRIDELEQHVVDLYRHKEEIDRRVHNMNRPARVVELGKDKDGKLDGTAKVAYGLDENGEDVISPFIPWITRAGDLIKVWAPPAIGEQVRLQSPSGDIGTHSWIELGGFQVPDDQQGQNSGGGPGANQSNPQLFKQNHNEEEQHKLTIGKFSVLYKDGNVVFVSSYNASATPLQQGNKQQDAPPGIIQFYSGDDGSSVPQAPKKSIHLTQGSKDGSIVAQATGDQGVITVLAQGSQGSIALLAPNGNGAVSVLAAKTVSLVSHDTAAISADNLLALQSKSQTQLQTVTLNVNAAGEIEIVCGGAVNVNAGGPCSVIAGGQVSISAPRIDLN